MVALVVAKVEVRAREEVLASRVVKWDTGPANAPVVVALAVVALARAVVRAKVENKLAASGRQAIAPLETTAAFLMTDGRGLTIGDHLH